MEFSRVSFYIIIMKPIKEILSTQPMIHRLEWECQWNKNRELYYKRDATAFKFISKFNHINFKKKWNQNWNLDLSTT